MSRATCICIYVYNYTGAGTDSHARHSMIICTGTRCCPGTVFVYCIIIPWIAQALNEHALVEVCASHTAVPLSPLRYSLASFARHQGVVSSLPLLQQRHRNLPPICLGVLNCAATAGQSAPLSKKFIFICLSLIQPFATSVELND